MKQTLDNRTSELEAARKRSNREAPATSSAVELSRSSSSKSDSSIVREEVAGLKYDFVAFVANLHKLIWTA